MITYKISGRDKDHNYKDVIVKTSDIVTAINKFKEEYPDRIIEFVSRDEREVLDV